MAKNGGTQRKKKLGRAVGEGWIDDACALLRRHHFNRRFLCVCCRRQRGRKRAAKSTGHQPPRWAQQQPFFEISLEGATFLSDLLLLRRCASCRPRLTNESVLMLRLATQLPSVQAAATLLFVALRTRKKHLLVESEQAIRRNLGIDPMNTLVPLFGPIEGALDGVLPANGAETQRQYAQNVEEERWQLAAIQPPSSKRMSLGTLSGNVPSQQSLCYSRLSFLFH
ncbi:hypothetical protein niasHT_020726 [Heterodera trifolii]|uniref:Uncharacterized protein n=1 Tax=Heterodera trifolii TaxID=157864 RepID=A0ABD2I9W5_9BILA